MSSKEKKKENKRKETNIAQQPREKKKKNVPGNRKEGLCCKENVCQERETKRKKSHNMKSLKCGGWEEARMSSSETWKQRLAGACLSENGKELYWNGYL